MIDYTTLKHSSDGIPTWDALLGVVLKLANEKQKWTTKDITTATVKELNLPDELREKELDSGNEALKRAGFALSALKVAGYLRSDKRAEYEITELGKKAWDKYKLNLSRTVVQNEPLYKAHVDEVKKAKSEDADNNTDNNIENDVDIDVDEPQTLSNENSIQEWFNLKTEETKDHLLAELTKMNPYAFETLMVNLLNRMGYKGSNGQSIVTQKSKDNGIDGVIYQDALGLQKVYLQVKRYAAGNSVGSPEITSFSGAVNLKHMDRGVFITTSTFTSDAYEAAKGLNIVTIDGDALTNLMIQYRVGVEEAKTYYLYRINKDDFTE